MHQVTIEDSRRHALPADAPESWQESFFLGWYDPATRSGGHHHISIKPKQDHAHVWSWLVVGGVLVGRAQQHRLEGRRVGKEGGSTCNSRWAPEHVTNKIRLM